MTNREKLNSLTNEQMSKVLMCPLGISDYFKEFEFGSVHCIDLGFPQIENCFQCIQEWLEKEAK